MGWWEAEVVRVRMVFAAGVADERRAVFAEGADSISMCFDAAGAQGCLCGFVASDLVCV